MDKIMMVYLPLIIIIISIITGLVFESINKLSLTFKNNAIKLYKNINQEKMNYLLIKIDELEIGKLIPIYNIKVLLELKKEYQKFIYFYSKGE